MRRPIATILPAIVAPALVAVATFVAASSSHLGSPVIAATQRLYLPIAARKASVLRAPLTRWTLFERTRFNDLDVDANGVAFASTDDGVLRWDSVSGEHRWLTEAEGVPAGAIGALAVDRTGGLWLAAKPTETVADADATTGVRRLAPDGTWQAFTTADGLAGNAVYAIEVDPEGRVWVAAWHGVSRREKDGSWTDVRNPDEDVPCDGVDCWHTKLAIAFGGGMTWFRHAGGVSRFKPSFGTGGWWSEYPQKAVHRIAADPLGDGWTLEHDHEHIFHYRSEGPDTFTHTVTQIGIPFWRLADIVFDGSGRLWTGSGDRMWSMGTDGRWRDESDPAGWPTDGLARLAVDPAGRVWAALAGAIARIDADGNGPVLHVGLPMAGPVRTVAPAPDGSVWLGVRGYGSPLGGLVRIGRDGRWTSRRLDDGVPDTYGVARVVFGRDGTMWATADYRLLRRGQDGAETVFDSSSVVTPRAVLRDLVLDGDGTLWVGIYAQQEGSPVDGVLAISPDGRWRHLRTIADGIGPPLAYDAQRSEVWFGGPQLSVRAADGIMHRVQTPDDLTNRVERMVIDGQGRRWFAGGGHLWSLTDDGHWVNRTPDLGFTPPEGYVGILALAADPDGGIWCGTSNGLVRLNVDGTWQRIDVPIARPDAARYGGNSVTALAVDAAGRLWAVTSEGVARLE